jgi:hypothetical protein
VDCVWYAAILGTARVGGKTSLVEGYQMLRSGEEYPGNLGQGTPHHFAISQRIHHGRPNSQFHVLLWCFTATA